MTLAGQKKKEKKERKREKKLKIFKWKLLDFIDIESVRLCKDFTSIHFYIGFSPRPFAARSSKSCGLIVGRQERAVEKFEWLNSWRS